MSNRAADPNGRGPEPLVRKRSRVSLDLGGPDLRESQAAEPGARGLEVAAVLGEGLRSNAPSGPPLVDVDPSVGIRDEGGLGVGAVLAPADVGPEL